MLVKFKKHKHEIKFDDDLAWLAPYLRRVQHIIPIKKLIEVRGYEVPADKLQQQFASCIEERPNKYKINLLTWFQDYRRIGRGKFEVSGYTFNDCEHRFEETLMSFAHELAHLVEWEHTADRFILEARITLIFSNLAKKRGYKGYKQT